MQRNIHYCSSTQLYSQSVQWCWFYSLTSVSMYLALMWHLFIVASRPPLLSMACCSHSLTMVSTSAHVTLLAVYYDAHILKYIVNTKNRIVRVGGVNEIGDKSRLSATENFETVLSSLEMRRELSLVLSWPSFHGYLLWRHLETSSQMRSHRRQDKTVLSVSNIWKLSGTVANSVHTTDKTRQDSLQHIQHTLIRSKSHFPFLKNKYC